MGSEDLRGDLEALLVKRSETRIRERLPGGESVPTRRGRVHEDRTERRGRLPHPDSPTREDRQVLLDDREGESAVETRPLPDPALPDPDRPRSRAQRRQPRLGSRGRLERLPERHR